MPPPSRKRVRTPRRPRHPGTRRPSWRLPDGTCLDCRTSGFPGITGGSPSRDACCDVGSGGRVRRGYRSTSDSPCTDGRSIVTDDFTSPQGRGPRQDRQHARRPLRRSGLARHRGGLVRGGDSGPRPAARRSRHWPNASNASRRPSRSACGGEATTKAPIPAGTIGRYYRLARPLNSPQVLTRPHPPILIGGGERKTLRLVARYAQAGNLFPGPELPRKLDILRTHCEAEGRDYREIRKTTTCSFDVGPNGERVERILDDLGRLAELGVQAVTGGVRDGCRRRAAGSGWAGVARGRPPGTGLGAGLRGGNSLPTGTRSAAPRPGTSRPSGRGRVTTSSPHPGRPDQSIGEAIDRTGPRPDRPTTGQERDIEDAPVPVPVILPVRLIPLTILISGRGGGERTESMCRSIGIRDGCRTFSDAFVRRTA